MISFPFKIIVILHARTVLLITNWAPVKWHLIINTMRPRQNGCHFADDIFKCIILNENIWIPIKNSLKFVPKGQINNIPTLGSDDLPPNPNIGSGDGLVRWDNTPLPEPMFTKIYVAIWCHYGTMCRLICPWEM